MDVEPGKVLVVEDDAFSRALLRDMVAEQGHVVLTAEDGQQALDVIQREAVDVVLLDLVMPGIHGLEVLERIRALDPSMEVIVCTAVNEVDAVVRALRGRAFDYLVKPIVPVVLQHAVTRAMDARRLLGENHRLRQALDLVLAGQRLLATADSDRVCQLFLDSLLALTGSTRGAVGRKGELMAHQGMDRDGAAAALGRAHGAELLGQQVATFPSAEMMVAGTGPSLVVALGPTGIRGVAARPREQAEYEFSDVEAAHFLVRHAQMSLQNQVRFAEATDAARRDSLTGLLNARVFEQGLVQAVERSKKEGNRFAVLFLDLDGFKQVNDRHGHLLGSRLLVEVSELLLRAVRDEDLVSRYGGDEFAVFLANSSEQHAMAVAERVRASLERHPCLAREGVRVHVTVSIGVAVYPRDGATARELMSRADAAMYEAKHQGKNRVVPAQSLPGAVTSAAG